VEGVRSGPPRRGPLLGAGTLGGLSPCVVTGKLRGSQKIRWFLKRFGGSGRLAAPPVHLWPGAPGAWLALLPPGLEPMASRVGCKPGPVPALSYPRAGEDHSSRRRIAAPLEHSTRTPGPASRRGRRTGRPQRCPYLSLLREGLAPPPVTRLSRVGPYPTFSPLPVPLPGVTSRTPGLVGHRRCGFCCAFPRVTPGRR
jgi:hypothetical protein